MRTTKDLINELHSEAGKFFFVALAVGFDKTTTFIPATEENGLEKLNQATKDGGEPIGMVGFVKDTDHSGTFYTKLLDEYRDEEWARKFLDRLMGSIARVAGIDPSQARKQEGWIN
jgi:hypothetical protein